MTVIELFAALLVAHAVCDYPLQGDFLARAKNHTAPIPGVPWPWAMGAHAAIHGGAVAGLTGSLALGGCEFVAHWTIDQCKCEGWLRFSSDQVAHIVCKAAWVTVWACGVIR